MDNQSPESNIPQNDSGKTENVFEVVRKLKIPNWISWVVLCAVVVLASVVIVYSTTDVCNGWKKELFEGLFGIKCPMSVGVYQNKNKNLDVKKENKTQQKNETADWKTYRNEKYGFEVKYPVNWVLKDLMVNPNQLNDSYDIGISYISPEQNALRGPTYCEVYSGNAPGRCEVYKQFIIDWFGIIAMINDVNGGTVGLSLKRSDAKSKEIFRQILSTFEFIKSTNFEASTNSCNADDDCVLWICSGTAVNKEWAKSAPPDLPCATYYGYRAICVQNKCMRVR